MNAQTTGLGASILATETVCDALGTPHPRAASDARIVSLVPSLTELLCALDLQEQIVGRTGFCIHPRESVKCITKVGGTKDVDVAKLRGLKPTHVIVNIDENKRDLADELAEFVPNIIVTHPLAPNDNVALFESFGFWFNRDSQAQSLVEAFGEARQRLQAIATNKPSRVLYLIWREPWMTVTGDTYIARTLSLIDWQTVPETAPARYPEIELADFRGEIDRVLLSSEPYPFREKHLEEVRVAFDDAVDVRLVDGEMLSWYGSRAIAGIDYLAELAMAESG